MTGAYGSFLSGKRRVWGGRGIEVKASDLRDGLWPFQSAITSWALRKGCAAIWADTGLGKTRCQVTWCRHIPGRSLILVPLCVVPQTVKEAAAIGVEIGPLNSGAEIEITNYERLHHVEAGKYDAVVLDESSILKSFDGKTRTRLVKMFGETPYRLCCTATPAPNDISELANHCEFLGVMSRSEMLATFFVHDEDGWRLRGHAGDAFYKWLASWGMFVRKPSDLGFADDGYDLPGLSVHDVIVGEDFGLARGLGDGIRGRLKARRESVGDRVAAAAGLARRDGQWIVWCGLNDEQEAVTTALDGESVVSVSGTDDVDDKQAALTAFVDGRVRVLVTKPRIAGFGLNLQKCHQMVFLGLGDSYESYYQAIRRCYRFGQTETVDAYIVVSAAERVIVENVRRKEAEADMVARELVSHMAESERDEIGEAKRREEYSPSEPMLTPAWLQRTEGPGAKVLGQDVRDDYALYHADSVEFMTGLPESSVDLSVFSPPFASLYTYTASERDLGNCGSKAEFLRHFRFAAAGLLRVTKPGRLACCHIAQMPLQKARDGVIGLSDLRGPVISAFEAEGWIYHGDIVVDKDPQALRHGTRVLTPVGWKPIESIQVGEEVIGGDGRATKVLGVWPQGCRPTYRMTFSDGVSVECDGAHLWAVRRMGRKWRNGAGAVQWEVHRTDELSGRTHMPSGISRYEIPTVSAPVEFGAEPDLPVDPYTLGVLLGDGCLSRDCVEFVAEPEIAARVAGRFRDGCVVSPRPYGVRAGVKRYAITHPDWHVNPLLSGLKTLGLDGCRAWEKRVPDAYRTAAPEDRLEILRGLMDTDGTCKRNGMPYFATVSERLARDVVEIVQSLGGLARVYNEDPTYRYKGEVRHGRRRHVVAVSMPASLNPFAFGRKAARWHHGRAITRRIVAVEPSGEHDCTCITVAALDGLFVIEHGVVTHNSQAIRTKSKALLFVQLRKDSSWLRPALADYIVVVRKPGDNAAPIRPDITNEQWIEWARPIWYGIRESDTLNVREARGNDDDRHICPLQLGTIERCVRLWSNPGETVFSPFAGIGSEGYEAVRLGRRFVGSELKKEYFEAARKNLGRAVSWRVDASSQKALL